MEKYFQGPKGMDGKFQSLAFPIWDVSIWNCSFFCFTTHHPSWRKPLAAATITPQIFVRCWWKLQHALVPGKKPCCYQKESSLGFLVSVVVNNLWWVHQSTPSFEKADILQDCGSTPWPLCCVVLISRHSAIWRNASRIQAWNGECGKSCFFLAF